MLQPTRIEMTEGESTQIEGLLEEHGPGSLTRRDPGETGPVVYHSADNKTFHVYDDHYEEVTVDG